MRGPVTDVLARGRVAATIDPGRGARLTSLTINGLELLAHAENPATDPTIADGCFAMVPWAGRVRDGLLRVDGGVHQLPVTDGPNALHGLGHRRTWSRVDEGRYQVDIGDPWPSSGTAELVYTLLDDGLRIDLSWTDGTDLPCSIGLHPWFHRRLDRGDDAVLRLDAEAMVERGADALPTGALVEPTAGPWDDCFRVGSDPVLTWPGALELTLAADTAWWVVYDQPAGTICVEPQTAPPDAFDHPGLRPPGEWARSIRLELRGRPL